MAASFLATQSAGFAAPESNFSQPSSDLSLDEEREVLRRETEKQAITQLERSRVRF